MWLGPGPVNAIGVQFVMGLLDLATKWCDSGLRSENPNIADSNIVRAKRAYGLALRYAGHLSFSVRQVSAFETSSVRLEAAIGQLQTRCKSWKASTEKRINGSHSVDLR